MLHQHRQMLRFPLSLRMFSSLKQAQIEPNQVKLDWNDHKQAIPHVWLRDHCRCPDCFHTTSFQRLFDSSDIPLDIQPIRFKKKKTKKNTCLVIPFSLLCSSLLSLFCLFVSFFFFFTN